MTKINGVSDFQIRLTSVNRMCYYFLIKPISVLKGIQKMQHVFISYMHEDTDIVDRLCEELTSRGINVWLDRNDIDPGVRWKQAIQRAIREGAFL